MAAPTSATGGYLPPLPAPAPVPLEGQALNRFFQQFVVGITGMQGSLVRPSWQTDPPNIPPAATSWAAIATTIVDADTWPAVIPHDDQVVLQRHEEINILSSFYDLGTNGEADALADRLRDGLAIPQNLEALFLANMGLRSVGSVTTVPSLLNERWLYRVDFPFVVARQVTRAYRVLPVQSVDGTIVTSDGLVLEIDVQPPP